MLFHRTSKVNMSPENVLKQPHHTSIFGSVSSPIITHEQPKLQGVSLLSVKSNLVFLDLSNHHKFKNMGLFLPELKHNFAEMDPTSQT